MTMGQINAQALARYQPAVYPHRLTLFRAIEKPAAGRADPALGWGPLAAGGVEVVEVPGTHDTILDEPAVQVLAERLWERLQREE